MPISFETLKASITPHKTALLLGAGASVPSGAPTGAGLSEILWRKVAKSDALSDDITETASILVRKYSRKPVVEAIKSALGPLKPTGGLVGLPKFGWDSLFTTNYDRLLEHSYKQNGISLVSIRSNYDFTSKDNLTGTRLYKIHGCITQDESVGDKASMILTEADYESYAKYRQSMFSLLEATLLTRDVLIVGQSLKDRHLHDLIRKVLDSKREGAPGQVYSLIYDKDDLRAPLLEDRGARIAFGGIDEFVHLLAADFIETKSVSQTEVQQLPISIVSATFDLAVELTSAPNIARMFNGGPATYADINAGATFERDQLNVVAEAIESGSAKSVAITGSAGVGKTTFARQILLRANQRSFHAWQHKGDFVFDEEPWLRVESDLRAKGEKGILLIDECTHFMGAVNAFASYLAQVENPALCLVLTANSAQWAPRIKSPHLYSGGLVLELSRLTDAEIQTLINLVQFNSAVTALVDKEFKQQSRADQFKSLRQKCSADMFVCLKNIFANESLDIILLQEFDELAEPLQEYYRFVAALEAVGMRVHRQLVIRMLNVLPTRVATILDGLSGIVDEYDIEADSGIYGWSTRHLVIARKITDYKFSSLDELTKLFELLIENLNPAVPIELHSIRAICDVEFGIGRIGDAKTKIRLYKRLIEVAPAERIPWHRLIRELLNEGELDTTEYVIRNAQEAAGLDAPISRYKVRLLVTRAQRTPGISDGDRLALLRKAYELAMQNIGNYRWDKYSYRELCEVAVELVKRGESSYLLDEAIIKLRQAADSILDPDIARQVGYYESLATRLR